MGLLRFFSKSTRRNDPSMADSSMCEWSPITLQYIILQQTRTSTVPPWHRLFKKTLICIYSTQRNKCRHPNAAMLPWRHVCRFLVYDHGSFCSLRWHNIKCTDRNARGNFKSCQINGVTDETTFCGNAQDPLCITGTCDVTAVFFEWTELLWTAVRMNILYQLLKSKWILYNNVCLSFSVSTNTGLCHVHSTFKCERTISDDLYCTL